MADSFLRSTIAAGKGLLVVLWMTRSGEDEVILVCNPVTKSSEDLPLPFTISSGEYLNPATALVVGGDMLSYKLFVIQECSINSARKLSFVYNTIARKWHPLYQVPCLGWTPSCVKFSATWQKMLARHLNRSIQFTHTIQNATDGMTWSCMEMPSFPNK